MARRQSNDLHEHYVTPAWAVRRLLEELPSDLAYSNWLDPCCGTGAIKAACRAIGRWTEFDIVSGRGDGRADYLNCGELEHFDVCFMNPPFSQAFEFVKRACSHCGVVIALQRLNWLASQERNEWMRLNPPSVYVLPNRPDFTAGGGDSHDYAWFVWGAGPARLRVLASTPLEVRKAQKPMVLLPNTGIRPVIKPRRNRKAA